MAVLSMTTTYTHISFHSPLSVYCIPKVENGKMIEVTVPVADFVIPVGETALCAFDFN